MVTIVAICATVIAFKKGRKIKLKIKVVLLLVVNIAAQMWLLGLKIRLIYFTICDGEYFGFLL